MNHLIRRSRILRKVQECPGAIAAIAVEGDLFAAPFLCFLDREHRRMERSSFVRKASLGSSELTIRGNFVTWNLHIECKSDAALITACASGGHGASESQRLGGINSGARPIGVELINGIVPTSSGSRETVVIRIA